MMKILAIILTTTMMFSLSLLTSENKKITVSVVNATTDNGKVSFALFDEVTFMKTPLEAKSEKIIDGKMDFNENGMPLEDYGSSNNNINFGPPSFLDSKFRLAEEDLTLEVKFQ